MADDIIITTVAPRLIEREQQTESTKFFREKPEPIEVPREPITLSLWQKMRLVPYVFQIFYGVIMKDAKTTITAIVGAVAYITNSLFGIGIPQDAIIAVTVFVIGLFASDAKKD